LRARVQGQVAVDGSGVSLSIADSGKAAFGNGDDLLIYHDGTDSKIVTSTGDLWVQTTADDLVFKAADDINFHPGTTETGLLIKHDAGVEAYYDNAKKFETDASGAKITGRLKLDDNYKVSLGNDADLAIWHDGSNSYIEDGGTGDLMIESNSAIRFRDNTGGVDLARMTNGGGVELYFDNSKKFETLTTGVRAQGGISFGSDTSDANHLADYEQGTWTPTMTNATIATQHCAKYTKIGNVVYIQMYITTAAGSGTGSVTMGGLPFTVSSDSNYSSFASGRIGAGNYNNAQNDIVFQFSGASTVVTPRVGDGNINEGMIGNTHLMFAGFYHV
jgi:hypothetical protein